MRNSLIELVVNYLLDAKNIQSQFKDWSSKEYCKEMDWLIEKLLEFKGNEES